MIERQVAFFRAIGNNVRLDIIHLLAKGPRTVTEIHNTLKLEQSHVSHNLRVLEQSGIVIAWKFGNWRKYSLHKEFVTPILTLSKQHIKNTNKVREVVSF